MSQGDIEFQEVTRKSLSNKESTAQDNQRALDKLKIRLRKQDLVLWAKNINIQQGDFAYPANLEISKEKMLNSLLIPGQSFSWKFITMDFYEKITPKYGISVPFYFTMIKLQITILLIIFLLFGLYFCILSNEFCTNEKILSQGFQEQRYCHYIQPYFFVPNSLIVYVLDNNDVNQKLYYSLASIAFVVMTIAPFIHEIMMRIVLQKYWKQEIENNPEFDIDRSIYIKHVQKQMSKTQIVKAINEVWLKQGNNETLFNANDQVIQELVYIYDYSKVNKLNTLRKQKYLELMQSASKLNADPENQDIKDDFSSALSETILLTKQIELQTGGSLRFSNKIMITMRTSDQAKSLQQLFKRSKFGGFISNIMGLRTVRQRQKSMKIGAKKVIDIVENDLNASALQTEQSMNDLLNNQPTNLKDFLNNDIVVHAAEERNFQDDSKPDEEDIKHIQLKQPPLKNDVFWGNLSVHSLKRLRMRFITVSISIITTSICLGAFELLYIAQNQPDVVEKILAGNITFGFYVYLKHLFLFKVSYYATNLFIVFLAVVSNIIVVAMALKSHRSSYTSQENHIINFMTFSNMIMILSFPWILILSAWHGLDTALPVYDLITLCRIRILFKGIAQVFHVRIVSYFFRRKNILKQIENNNIVYYQSELNTQLTPPYFPIRTRIYFILFVYWTGCLILYLVPYVIFWCLLCLLFFYFYDKYSVTRVYQVDPYFNFYLYAKIVRQVFIVMLPVITYVFACVFRSREVDQASTSEIIKLYINPHIFSFGIAWGGLMWLLFMLRRDQIGDFFIYRIMKYKPFDEQIANASYSESYDKYKQQLQIYQLTRRLTEIYTKLEIQRSEI